MDNDIRQEVEMGEVLKFVVGSKKYAISVSKVKEILPLGQLTPVPNSAAAVLGMTLIRGEVVVVVDMQRVLDGRSKTVEELEGIKILLCDMGGKRVAFCVDSVIGIHHLSEEQVHSPDKLIKTGGIIANIEYEGAIYMLLDFDKILEEIA